MNEVIAQLHVRKSVRDYAVYFVTLVLGVCVFYAFNTIKSQAKRLVTRPDIIKEIARQKEEMAAKVEDKYAGLKDEMVDCLVKGIREGTDPEGCAIGIVDFVPAIKQLSTMLGWDAPKDINLRNGGYTKDYQGPPTLMTMSDEEISAKLKELRGDG